MLLQQLQKEVHCSCGKSILLTFREVGQIASCSCGQAYRMEINILPSGEINPPEPKYVTFVCKCGDRREVNAQKDEEVILCRCGEEMEPLK